MILEAAFPIWLLALAVIPIADFNFKPREKDYFLPEDLTSEEVYGPPVKKANNEKWYGKSWWDEAGVGLAAFAIILFSKPWK